jgi:hypothetical protein
MGDDPPRLICLRDHLLFGQVTYLQVIENKNANSCAQDGFRESPKPSLFNSFYFKEMRTAG